MEIIICSTCKGKGKTGIRERYELPSVTCSKCKGSGRVLMRTYTLELALEDEQEFYQADEKIMSVIREVKNNS